jgi:hypothetical protein
MGQSGIYGRCTLPPDNGFKKSKETAMLAFTSLPLSWSDHLIAILVNPGVRPKGGVSSQCPGCCVQP